MSVSRGASPGVPRAGHLPWRAWPKRQHAARKAARRAAWRLRVRRNRAPMAARRGGERTLRMRPGILGACDFWKQVGKEAFGGWDKIDANRIGHLKDAVDRTRMIPRLSRQKLPARLRSDLDEYSGYYVRLYRAIARRERMRRHGRLEQARLAGVLPEQVPEIDLRVIHMVRDSRAVAYSWTTKVARPEASAPGQDRTARQLHDHLCRRRGRPATGTRRTARCSCSRGGEHRCSGCGTRT